MAVRPSHYGPAGLLLAGVVLSVSWSAATAAAALACDFQPDCRPGETYRLPIPCEGKCAFYIQCDNGVPTEAKCGKFFFQQRQFDAEKLECVKATDCDWWKKISTTTTTTTTTTSTAAPTTTTGTPAPDTTPPASSTEGTSTSTTVTPEPPTSPPTPAAPTSTTPPSESGAAAPLAALGPALLAAAVALIL